MSVYDAEVTLVVESDHTQLLDLRRWISTGVEDPEETVTALVCSLNQVILFDTNRSRNVGAERVKQFFKTAL